jgi:excisionase family DNA binding protein
MQSTAIPANQSEKSLRGSDDFAAPSSSDRTRTPALLACILIPADKTEQVVSMLRELLEQSSSEAQVSSSSSNTFQPASSWLTHSEAASYLGIGVSTLYRYAETERIECRKLGNRLEYRRSSLDRFKDSLIRPARRQRTHAIIPSTLGSGN